MFEQHVKFEKKSKTDKARLKDDLKVLCALKSNLATNNAFNLKIVINNIQCLLTIHNHSNQI